MAKTTISGADVSILRGNQATKDLSIHITPLTEVQSGLVTAVPAIDPYVSITWDGSTSGIVVGQMVKITNSSTLRTWGVIRKAPVSTTLYINEIPLGSPGYTTEIESAIQVGDTVTVYNHHPMWGLHSRIANRSFYQTWDVAYTDQNEDIPPVANAGQWQSAKITSGSAAFTLPRFGTNTSFAMSGTISTHLWTLPAGVTLQSGYATSDDVIAVDAVAGTHLISYKVTDSNSKTHTAYTWLFVSDGTTGTSLDERYPVNGLTIQATQKGLTGSFTMVGTSLETVLYPGAGILINETPHFANGTLTDGVFVDTFCGYVSSVDYTYSEGRVSSVVVGFESPIIFANRIVQPEQSLTEVANPANWTQCTSAMSNPRGAFYFAWKHKTPALGDMHDIDANSLTTPRRKNIDFNTKSLGQAIETVAKMFLINIGSAADGTTVLREYPQYMDNTDRNSLVTRMTWTAQDFSLQGGLRYTMRLLSEVSESVTGAFAYNGSVTRAWLAGKKWNQGQGTSELPNFTVALSGGLTRVLEVVGHYHAEQNRAITEIPLTLIGNQDVIDLSYLIWDKLTISSTYDPRGTGWSAARMLASRVDRTWSKTTQGYEKTINIALQPETFGQPGKQIPIGNVRTTSGNRQPVAFTPKVSEALGGVGLALAVNDVGQLAVTYDYLSDSPQWNDISGYFTGDICDFDWDFNSGFFSNGYSITEQIGVYVCTIDSTTFRVYRIPDIKSVSFVAEELTSATMADGTMNYNARVKCSQTTTTLVLAAWKDRTGVEFVRSTDGGSTWSSKANIGSAITDSSDNDDAHIGLDIYGAHQVVTAPDSTPEYGLYIATTAGGSFSAVTNTQRTTTPLPLVKQYSAGNCYATLISSATTVNFEPGGYGSYTISTNIAGFTAGENAVGNPGDAAQGTGSWTTGNNEGVKVDINLGSTTTINNVLLDMYLNDTSASNETYTYHVEIYDSAVLQDAFESAIYTEGTDFTAATWVAHNVDTDSGDAGVRDAMAFPVDGDQVLIWIHIRSSGTGHDVRLDNIEIITAGGGGNTLYKVTDMTGTSVWTDVSPAATVAPVRPHDLSIDIIDTNDLHTVADDDKWYSSTDAASNWSTEESSTDKRTPYSVGDAIIFGGDSEVKLALDGTTFDNKTGNLAAAFGTISTIKKILPL